MATSYTSLLGLALPVTGELSGTWGDTVNNYITSYVDAAVAGVQIISGSQTAVTLSVTNGTSLVQVGSGATGSSQYGIIRCTGNPASLLTITAPAASKSYLIINSTSTNQSVKIVGTGPTTGVTLVAGESAVVAWNGTDFIKVASSAVDGVSTFSAGTTGFTPSTATSGAVTLAGTLATTNGGTGLTSFTANGVVYASSTSALATGSALTFDGTNFGLTGRFNITAASNQRYSDFNTTSAGYGFSSYSYNGTAFGYVSQASAAFGGGANTDFAISAVNNLVFGASNTEQMRLTSTGLGIGTNSPDYQLVVSKASDTYIKVANTSASITAFYGAGSTGAYVGTGTNHPIQFIQNGSEQMRLTSTGLGIGTSSPGAKLDVNGQVRAAFASGFQVDNAGTMLGKLYYSGGLILDRAASTNLFFQQNSSTQMLLDSSGNLGLGVTPSAWNSGFKAIQIGAEAIMYSGTGGSSGFNAWGSNFYVDSAGNSRYIRSSYANIYQQNRNLGVHAWFNAPSGTAGDLITFTQAMTLDASGNLLVGTTSASFASGGGINVKNASTSNVRIISGSSTGFDLSQDTGGNTYIYNRDNGFMAFATNNTERARITSGGYFKASNTGTYLGSTGDYHELRSSNDNYLLYAINTRNSGGGPFGISVEYSAQDPNGTGNEFLQCVGISTLRAEIRSNGGIANYSANNVSLSDRREKTNFAPAKSYLDTICAIPVQTFNYIDQSEDDPGLTLGVVAQDVQTVAPELVMESNWGTKEDPKMRLSIYQTDLQYALMKCIQELKAEVDSLKAQLKGA